MLGKDRAAFSFRYCNRRLVPVGRNGSNSKKYDNSGLSRAGELHALLKEVGKDGAVCHSRLAQHPHSKTARSPEMPPWRGQRMPLMCVIAGVF